ncbi:MAG TPA: alpha/beta hydrolase [Steroidobacteraceae bacterium]|jgi:arylformamidase|nr:alpha/beta hydrolase [Steroidobacteraceae bacterium]
MSAEVNSVPAPDGGSLVWLDMDQTALDKAYNQGAYASNRQQLLDRYVARSNATRALRGNPLRRAYGNSEIEQLDIYVCDAPAAPINIFIHGGAWRLGSASECGFFAELFCDAGAHLVVPDFIGVEQAGGSLFPMVEQVRKSIAWVHANAHTFNGDRRRIYLSGTSSGAHLAAVALTSDWLAHRLPHDVFLGALLCSGIYDLEPVRRSSRSAYVRFTDEMVERLSPLRHLDRLHTPLIVVYGSLETPEFQRQSQAFAQAVKERGLTVELHLAEGYNHFEIHETLGDPYDVLGRAVLGQMGLR